MERKLRRAGRQLVAMAIAVAFVTVLVPVTVRAEVSDYWAEKDVDVRLEPHYANIIYTLDPIETLQRFDAKGDWYWPATTDMNDSKLILTAATNASLNVKNDADLDDGKYFEVRANSTSGANFTFALKQNNGNYTSMIWGANARMYAKYKSTEGTGVTTTNMSFTCTQGSWWKFGIDLSTAAAPVFYVFYDTNESVAKYITGSNANMTYDEVDEVDVSQSVAAKTTYVDYVVSTSTYTELTPIGQASRALRVDWQDSASRRNVAYTLDELKDVVTLSNESAVYDTIGYSPTGKDLSNDNKLNETDLGNILLETPEDVDAKFSGKTVVKGWDSVRDAVDESLENYVAERHEVSKAYIIDYYIDDLKVNVTVTEGLADKIEKTAIKEFMNAAEDKGADINYDDEVGLREDWTDFDFAYMPRDITAEKWLDMKEDLSNQIRKHTVSLIALTQERPTDVIEPMFSSPFSVSTMTLPLEGDLDVDTTYQETNALIGSVLTGQDYTAVDAETLDNEMATKSASGFNLIDSGKTATSGLSLISVFSSILLYVIVISVLCVSAILIIVLFMRHRKHKRAKRK